MPFIYKITNTINGHSYIGKTSVSVERRFNEHIWEANKERAFNRPLYSAFRKYPLSVFTCETIEECRDDILSERERFWIAHYDTYRNGYNATLGGDGTPKIDYDEVIELYRQYQNQSKVASILGINKYTVGKILASRQEVTVSNIEATKITNSISIKQLDKNGVELGQFSSIADASRMIKEIGASKDTVDGIGAHIIDVCKHRRRTAYGYKWEYI